MNKRYLKSNNDINKINLNIFISLIPLIIYGFYKNGIKLYKLGYVNFLGMFKPLLISFLGLSLGYLSYFLYIIIIKKKKIKFLSDFFSTPYPIYGVLISSFVSINTNYMLFMFSVFVVLFLNNFIKNNSINIVAFSTLLIIFLIKITSDFSFLNIYEQSVNLHLEPIDYFLGRGYGGINTTSCILLIISFIILIQNNYYKKEIPIFSLLTFLSLITLYGISKNDLILVLDSIATNGILFSFIYVSTISNFSSYTKKGIIIYSILIGILTFIFYLLYPSISAISAILIVSFINKFIDKLVER